MKLFKSYSKEEEQKFEKIKQLLESYNKAILRGERFSPPLSYEDRIACSEYFDHLKNRQTA